MGNHHTSGLHHDALGGAGSGSGSGPGPSSAGTGKSKLGGEPLESYYREKQRDDHLKNLGFKRSKSLRKSITKRLRKATNRGNTTDSRDKERKPPAAVALRDDESPQPLEQQPHRGTRDDPDGAEQRDLDQDKREAEMQKKRNSRDQAVESGADKASSSSGKKKSCSSSIERLDRSGQHTAAELTSKRRARPLVGKEPEPLPCHLQEVEGDRPRRMDRLRRSLRSSIRKRKHHRGGGGESSAASGSQEAATAAGGGGKPSVWKQDEISVRSGTCSFSVKYLGCVEVYESRGMQVCEEAIKVLKNSKRKSVRAILYVHGDGLRVVDDDTKGLVVDQTIEKVSFCAPDRNYERGFSYICRDGTTRRWMCHGFMAIGESGERLSHAVGCAFAICLEKKQERDRLASGVSMSFNKEDSSFTRFGSFRQPSITERLSDPQGLKPSTAPPPVEKVENPYAVARPHATDMMLARQTSFRGFNALAQAQSPFKRNLSLRLNDLPSTLERQMRDSNSGQFQSPKPDVIVEGEEDEDEYETLASNGAAPRNSAGQQQGGLGGDLEELLHLEERKIKETQNQQAAVPVQILKNHLPELYQLSATNNQNSSSSPSSDNHHAAMARGVNTTNPFQTEFDSQFGAEKEDCPESGDDNDDDPISSMCQQLSAELSLSNKENVANNNHQQEQQQPQVNNNPASGIMPSLTSTSSSSSSPSTLGQQARSASTEPNNDRTKADQILPTTQTEQNQPHSLPYIPLNGSNSGADSPKASTSSNSKQPGHNSTNSSKDPLANVKPVQYDNPWDFVPDQPCNKSVTNNQTKLVAKPVQNVTVDSTSVNSLEASDSSGASSAELNWFQDPPKSTEILPSGKPDPVDFWSVPGTKDGILEDPFDAEWAALATRKLDSQASGSNSANPFETDQFAAASKTFEMQM